MEFEKASHEKDSSKKRKRPIVTGTRGKFCATPLFARIVTEDDISNLANAFENAGKASLFVQTLKGNNYKPCTMFESSCNRRDKAANIEMPRNKFTRIDIFSEFQVEEMKFQCEDEEITERIKSAVGVSIRDCQVIELETQKQSNSLAWYFERSKRLTSSLFGRVMNRRQDVYPKSILDTIQKSKSGKVLNTASLQCGKDKVALSQYMESHSPHEFSDGY